MVLEKAAICLPVVNKTNQRDSQIPFIIPLKTAPSDTLPYLQMNPYVSELALYDIQGTPGVAADISHINSKAKTKVRVKPHSSELVLSMQSIWGNTAAAATSHAFSNTEMAAPCAVHENACDKNAQPSACLCRVTCMLCVLPCQRLYRAMLEMSSWARP